MNEQENKRLVALVDSMYQEGADYMKFRTLNILKEELARHRKGSSGHATVESLLNKVLELQSVT
jgi:hypothetical protein